MPTYDAGLVERFRQKASDVAIVMHDAPNMSAVADIVVAVCENKAPCEMLADEPGTPKGPMGPNGVPTRTQRVVAAPDLDDETYAQLAAACEAKGFVCIREGLHSYLAGIDIGVTQAALGVADSATCMVITDNEDVRLSGMVVEINMLILKKSTIHRDLPSTAPFLRERQADGRISYTTFITGPSRTADIERVGALGVHGPLELHIILLED